MNKIILEIAKELGKAFIVGVGVQAAAITGAHLKKRLGPSDDKKTDPDADVRAENERLKAEVERLRSELAAREPFQATTPRD